MNNQNYFKKKYHHEDYSENFVSTKISEYYCPYCNFKIDLSNKFCDCGWIINKLDAMHAKCPKWIFEKHKQFVNEYRYMKENGITNSGYKYFNEKIGHTNLGNIFVKKTENGYTQEEENLRRLNGMTENTFPKEWLDIDTNANISNLNAHSKENGVNSMLTSQDNECALESLKKSVISDYDKYEKEVLNDICQINDGNGMQDIDFKDI